MRNGALKQLAVLPSLSGRELRERYRALFDNADPPNSNKNYLIKRLAYRIQELALKQSLPEKARIQMKATLEDNGYDPVSGRPRKGLRKYDGRKVYLEPGTVLEREYKGQKNKVKALEHGRYEFEGKTYATLTPIAYLITGTRISGPAFFGLQSNDKKRKGR